MNENKEYIKEINYLTKKIFTSEEGKKILDFLLYNYVYTTNFVTGINQMDMAYFAGQADLVKKIYLTTQGNF